VLMMWRAISARPYVAGAGGTPLKVVIQNAGEASYPDGWVDYKVRGLLRTSTRPTLRRRT